MKNLTYSQYYDLIERTKGYNPYLYVSVYKEAKENLMPEQFKLLQQQIANVA